MAVNKKTKKKDKHSFLYYAMPWNLKNEIRMLGYEFSVKRIVSIYVAILFVMTCMGLAFKLSLPWIIPLIIAGLLFAPKMVRNSYKNKWENRRFSDINVYIEQMLYAFKNSQKILTALEDVRILFPDGPMKEVIDEAISLIVNPVKGSSQVNLEEQALRLIEARYPNQHVSGLHRFMLKVESIGGDFDSSVALLLDNRTMWENRVLKLQDKRKRKKSEILGSCAVSVLLCLVMLYILPSQVDIASMIPVRIVNVFMIIACVMIYLKGDTKLSSNLLQQRKQLDPKKVEQDFFRYQNYDGDSERKKSIFWAIIPAVMIGCGMLFDIIWLLVIGVILLPIMLCQHMIGHKLLERRLRREISVAFPQWLMELSLLLQTDNVQVSIFKTIDTALPILRPELRKLRTALTIHPDSPEPFLNFFSLFHMPEITTSMQMLYSLSNGSGGDSETQIANIVKRNNIILDRAEDMANDDSMAGLYTLFLAPMLAGCVVLMVDMTAFLLTFMSSMGL